MSGHPFTDEQQAVIDRFRAGRNLVVTAVAGAGKTTTIRGAAEAVDKRCLYIAFNRGLADSARKSMPRNVEARTYHSLAYRDVGFRFKHRLNASRLPLRASTEIMYAGGKYAATRVLNGPVRLTGGMEILPMTITRLALSTVERYCRSADETIGDHHVPRLEGVDGAAHTDLVRLIRPIADLAWRDLRHPNGKLRHTADHYFKVWALSNPRLNTSVILFDEAQDANPVLTKIMTSQRHAQLIAVGDSCQQLYAWRGAVDALENWPADERLTLSQSFRFGPAIAAEANRWLSLLNSPARVVGSPWINSTVGTLDAPDAVLCRTNAGAMSEVMGSLKENRRVHLVGGGEVMRSLAEAADQLMHGERTNHPEFAAFSSWDEVREYSETEAGGELTPVVKLIDEHGTDEIIATVKQLATTSDGADVIVSTAHKSKGLQWPTVRVADFREPRPRPYPTPFSPPSLVLQRSELMLTYVAVTRAQRQLDRDSLSWIDTLYHHDVPVVIADQYRAQKSPAPVTTGG
jgi:hypothetical protein